MRALFPAVRYLPEWFPGAGFKTTAKQWRESLQRLVNDPFDLVKKEVVSVQRSYVVLPILFMNDAANTRVLLGTRDGSALSRNDIVAAAR